MAREVYVRVRRVPLTGGGVPRIIANVRNNAESLSYNYSRAVLSGYKRRVHVITGHLRESAVRTRISKYHHEVRVGAFYGIYEEFGTRYRPPHPAFRPAVVAAKAQFQRDRVKVFTR